VLSANDRTTRRALRGLARAALLAALSAAVLAPATASAQSDEEKAAARALALKGADALNGKKFGEALDLVTRAEAIVHAPTHLLMIARAQAGLGKLVAAHETYLKLTREELAANAPAAFKNAQATAKEEIGALEPRIAQLRIILEGPGVKKASLKMDDAAVPAALVGVDRPVDPGHHVIAAYVTGGSPVKATVDLREGEKKEIRLVIPDAPPPAGVPTNAADNPDAGKTPPPASPPPGFMTPLRGAGIGAGAVGVGGVILGAIFMAKGGSTQSEANDLATKYGCTNGGASCPAPKTPAQQAQVDKFTGLDSDAAKQKTIGAIGLVAGGVLLAGGVTLLILGKPSQPAAPAKAQVEPWLGLGSAGLRGTF
jgi:hypothetical protein